MQRYLFAFLSLTLILGLSLPVYAENLGNDILYYIAVDRFFDGEPANNIPEFAFPVSNKEDGNRAIAYNQANRSLLPYLYDPNHRYVGMYWGGDLTGIIQKLDYLQDLGVTKLVLSPIQDSTNGLQFSPGAGNYIRRAIKPEDEEFDRVYAGLSTAFHGTWTKDWFTLEEHFREPNTGLETFRRLLDEAGERGIGIILELSLNSTSPYLRFSPVMGDFDPTQFQQWLVDNGAVYREGELVAPYNPESTQREESWFHPPLGINYAHPTAEMLEKGSVGGLPDLNQDNPATRDYLLDAVQFWLTLNAGGQQVAGFYLDGVANINQGFWQELETTVHEINPEAVLIAEYPNGGYRDRAAVDWLNETSGYTWVNYGHSLPARNFFAGQRGWDGRTYVLRENTLGLKGQYYNYSPLVALFHRLLNPSESLEIPARSLDILGDEKAKGWVNFIETHELPRLFSNNPDMSVEAYASLIKFIFTSPGVPLVMYGTETGLAVPYHIDHQGLFGIGGNPYNEPMMIWSEDQGWNEDLHQVTRKMAQLRQQYPVLRYGETDFLYPKGAKKANDLFMVREHTNIPPNGEESPRILYAYSSKGGEFHFSLAEHSIDRVEGIQPEQEVMISQEEWTIRLAPEESQVFILN